MGISTYQSYNGAQIFDAVGLNSTFINKYFSGTASLIEELVLKCENETRRRHAEESKRFRKEIIQAWYWRRVRL